jgi:hypothetical protein
MGFVARAERPQMPGIKKVGIKHEAILNFLLAHPTVKMRDVAAHFQVTQPWLSLVVHSDAFQKMLRGRQDIHFDVSILPAMDKVQMIVDQGLDRMLELVPHETDLGKLGPIVDKALTRLGYGTSTPATQVNVQVNVDRSMIERARSLIGVRAPAPALEAHTYEAGFSGSTEASRELSMGEDGAEAALPPEDLENPSRADGGEV